MKTRITTVAALLLAMFLVGEAVAQVPSSVTQQLRLSTGGLTPNYVQHRAIVAGQDGHITTSGPAPGTNGWYAWDQVPATAPGVNYLMFLNDLNEVRRTSSFGLAQQSFIATVNPTGTGIDWTDPDLLVTATNGLTEITPNDIELGGPLTHSTSIDQLTFDMSFVSSTGVTSTFTIGGGAGTLNTTIDPGTAGNLKLLNIDPLLTAETVLFLDGTNNVVSKTVDQMIDANNGLSESYATGVSTIQLGGPVGTPSLLIDDRFITMSGQDLNFTGAGNFNITGSATEDLSVNINTGTGAGSTGNFTLQGTTLTPAAPAPANFLYMSGNNVRSATAADLPAGTATTWLGVDGTGNLVTGDPMGGIFRGRVNGDGTHDYTVPVAGLLAGAAVTCTVVNATGNGTIAVQVSTVIDGSFDIECAENIQVGSSISWIAMNP